MANPMEGLAYFIDTQDTNPDAASRLSPRQKFDKFIAFCRDGKPDGHGGFEMTGDGHEIRGVLDWLVRLPIETASFFATEPTAAGTMFVATLDDNNVPWIGIHGFMDFVKTGPPPDIIDREGQIKMAALPDLGAEFARRVDLYRRIFELLPPENVPQFRDALSWAKPPAVLEAVGALEEPTRSKVKALLGLS